MINFLIGAERDVHSSFVVHIDVEDQTPPTFAKYRPSCAVTRISNQGQVRIHGMKHRGFRAIIFPQTS